MGHLSAWSDFDLWDAWLRVWALGTVNTEFRAMNALADFTATGDQKSLRGEALDPVFSDFEDPDYHSFFDRVVPMIEASRREPFLRARLLHTYSA